MDNAEFFSPENKSGAGDNFAIEELLNFADDDGGDDAFVNPAVAAFDSSNSSFSGGGGAGPDDNGSQSFTEPLLSNDLCVPYDDVAELEWLSNLVDDSFSTEELHNLNLISGTKPPSEAGSETHGPQTEYDPNTAQFQPDLSVPGKARSKRPRAAPCDWASRLSLVTLTTTPLSDDHPAPKKKPKKRDAMAASADGRKCLHCSTDKTPQWRTGPMGPKTLCNACGVRYKSGRLVPEYRPAASPTFVVAKHSNSHRKVMELRRQKEAQQKASHHPIFDRAGIGMFDGSNGDSYLIHQCMGPNFRHLF